MKTPTKATAFMQSRRVALFGATLFLGISGFSNAQTVQMDPVRISSDVNANFWVEAWALDTTQLSSATPDLVNRNPDSLRVQDRDANNVGVIRFAAIPNEEAILDQLGFNSDEYHLEFTGGFFTTFSVSDTSPNLEFFASDTLLGFETATFGNSADLLGSLDSAIANGSLERGRSTFTFGADTAQLFTEGSQPDVVIRDLYGLGGSTELQNNLTKETFIGLDGRVVANVPEPSSTALLGLGGLALIARRRR